MARCYDKYEAHRVLSANGIDCPLTTLGSEDGDVAPPLILKPRRGSDSIGLKLIRGGAVPQSKRTDQYLVQEHVRGMELTVGVVRGRAGAPLQIVLPTGRPYSFARKYLLPTRRTPVTDEALVHRVREMALRVAALMQVNWAARVDLIHEQRTQRLCVLECDVAPLIGARLAFAISFAASGITRARQLRLLLDEEM